MDIQDKTKEELINELHELKQEQKSLRASYNKDITKRKQAENLLTQTRENYETFFNTINDFLFVLDEQGNIIHTNSTVIDRLGYTQEELSGLSVLMVHPPERREEAGRIVGEMLSGVTTSCPVPIVTKSGVQIPVETTVSQGFWDGKPVIFGVTKDISKVKLSEEKFSKVFYLNPSACGLSDLDTGEYLEVNDQFYTLLGFDKNEVIGKTAIDLGILTQEAINAVMLNADSNGNITNVKADLKTRNGDIKHVLLSAENIIVQDKKYRYTIVHDITERKQADATQQELFDRLQKIASLVPGVVYQYQLRPDGTSCFPYSSEGINEIYRVTPEEVREDASKVFANLHPDDYDGVAASIQASAKELSPWKYEYRVKFDDGTVRWLSGNASPQRETDGTILWHGFITDITERKLAEKVLRESEDFQRNLLTSIPVGIFIIDPLTHCIEMINEHVAVLFGGTTDHLVGQVCHSLICPECEGTCPVFDLGQTVDNSDKVMLRKDGSKLNILKTVKQIQLNGQDKLLECVMDITERKRAEDQIRKLSTAVEQSPATVVITDLNGDIEYVNPKFISTTGYSFDEAISKNPRILKSDETSSEEYKELWETICSGKEWRGEFHNKKKNGELYWEFASISPIRNDKGITTHFLAIKEDISERKRAEGLLRESEERYKLITQNTLDIIFMLDKTGKLLFLNESVEKILGYKQEELVGKSFTRFVPLSEIPKYLLQLKNVFLKQEIHNFISKGYHKNGDLIDVEINGRLVKHNEKLVALGTIKDISEHIKAEIILKEKNEELSTINAEKDKFFSIIAHDLKSPFNSIIGFSDLLIEQINNNDDDGIAKYAKIIQQSSNRAMDLLMNLMEWSRSQTGRIEFNPENCKIVNCINETTLFYNDIAIQKSITIKNILPPKASVFADKAMLNTVLRNLVSNAIKFTHPGGEIIISAEKKQNEIIFSVSDSGVGISKSNIEKLFRIDNNYSTPGTQKEKGTGLGLILCKEFIEKHGGKIWVESEEGTGSTFYFTLKEIG